MDLGINTGIPTLLRIQDLQQTILTYKKLAHIKTNIIKLLLTSNKQNRNSHSYQNIQYFKIWHIQDHLIVIWLISVQMIPHCEDYPMHCKMFSTLPGPKVLDIHSHPYPPPVVMVKTSPDFANGQGWGDLEGHCPQLRILNISTSTQKFQDNQMRLKINHS